jgi:hypothetical protein
MEESLPWYRELGAQERTWVASVAQAGINAFIEWHSAQGSNRALTADVFGAAPRELARVISLEQTVDLVRTTIDVVEAGIDDLADEQDRPRLRESILRYSREIAFSAAEVYARAAEARGAWDARLESLVVDALLRDELDESVLGRVNALGWTNRTSLMVLAGAAPIGHPEASLDVLRRAALHHDVELLTGIHGTTLLAIAGGVADADRTARLLSPHFGPGPVVHSGVITGFLSLPEQARETLNGLRAAPGWPAAPRIVAADELLPERALLGDSSAVDRLISTAYLPLVGDQALLSTAAAYLEQSPSLESTARILVVHPNTVRYRLRRIAEITDYSPVEARGAFALRLALTLGRLTTL